ncbi:sugar transferase [Sanguibacter massiliensis]|uniref:sugar transferase n=1 Tax=Sanguibacter massiliensis TaxID=1973217 RepID=UPI0013EB0F43|nr:sugar transferase [Sanguibacter massiliensis]
MSTGDDRDGPGAITTTTPSWERRYTKALLIADAVVIAVALVGAHVLRADRLAATPNVQANFYLPYVNLSVIIGVVWFIGLSITRSRDRRVLGVGMEEFQRVFHASWQVFAVVAIVAYLTKTEIARSYIAVTFPIGLLALLTSRYVLRTQLQRLRRKGRALRRVLVVGNPAPAHSVITDLTADPRAGFYIVGVCLPRTATGDVTHVDGYDVLGSLDDVVDVVNATNADTVAITGSDAVTAQTVRELSWRLEGTGTHLVLVPALTDVSGPRVITSPVNGTTLVQIDSARFTGPRHVAKAAFDWLTALLITILISPVLLVISALVALTSGLPVLYKQERIGLDGKPFKMLKFRSMVPDAHLRLAEVLEAEGVEEVGMFYKPKNDPRVTPVGRVLRRYSLDELPQLFNVLRGEMSLVGPRPQIDKEVEQYDHVASRRLLVKPGLTGLWQVSGRSELEPEVGIRLDVYYVENWTVFGDLLILAKTAKAMIVGEGAY